MTNEQVLILLKEAPPQIAEVTAGLTDDQLHTRPEPDEWSANEVLGHLRSCADVWGACIETILSETRPTIRAVNPRNWVKRTNYLELDFRPSFQSFTDQRAKLLGVLEALRPEGWSRAATVTGAGKVLERTVLSYAQWLASHERTHVKQFKRLAIRLRIR